MTLEEDLYLKRNGKLCICGYDMKHSQNVNIQNIHKFISMFLHEEHNAQAVAIKLESC